MARWMPCLAIVLALCSPAIADHRLYMAAQYDFGAKRGFYLDFENSAPPGTACPLQSLRLILGTADGSNWRFVSHSGPWEIGRAYTARAVISAADGRLLLDGREIGSTGGGYIAAPGPLTMSEAPSWASDRTEYIIRQTSLKVTSGARVLLSRALSGATGAPVALSLFSPQQPETAPLTLQPGEQIGIEAGFVIDVYPSLRELSPFIDRYGQSIHARWPGKVMGDADLRRATAEEARRSKSWTAPAGVDRYGGAKTLGWKEKATGFYRVTRRAGVWWLITPDGNPCFYTGMCSLPGTVWERTPVTGREFLFDWLPPRTGTTSAAWHADDWGVRDGTETVAIQAANMARKYGDNWSDAAIRAAARRVRQWGFAGGGKWGSVPGLPYTPVLGRWDVPNLVRHPDVYDPAVRETFREVLRKQIEPERSSPLVVGWSLGNEYDEIVTKAEMLEVLRKPADVPAKRELCRWAVQTLYGGDASRAAQAWGVAADTVDALAASQPTPPDGDLERVRLEYARAYYAFVYQTVKALDPNHLYFGFWIVPGWWENASDWRVSAPFCDVIGYDRYAAEFMDAELAALVKETDKPILCGEFSFPPTYRGTRGYGAYPTNVPDEAAAGESYARWVADAARDSHCVGVMWFQYRDQPLTGRGPGRGSELVYGEHFAFGVVDLCDRPKFDLVERMRKANLGAPGLRARLVPNTPPPRR